MTNRNRVLKALREAKKPLSATDIAKADRSGKLTPETAEAAAEGCFRGRPGALIGLPDGRYQLVDR